VERGKTRCHSENALYLVFKIVQRLSSWPPGTLQAVTVRRANLSLPTKPAELCAWATSGARAGAVIR
jgi:hypothetical protein